MNYPIQKEESEVSEVQVFKFFKKRKTLEERIEVLEQSHNKLCDLIQELNSSIEQNKISNNVLKQDVQIIAQGLREIYNLTEQIVKINTQIR